MPFGCDRLHVADRKVLEFFLHRLVRLLFAAGRIAADRDRVRRADRRGRRHGGDASRDRDEATRAGGGCANRSDIDHHWNPGGEEALHNRLRGFEQSARRVQLHDQALRVLPMRLVDASRDVAGSRRPDRAVDLDQADLVRRARPPAPQQQEEPGRQRSRDSTQAEASLSRIIHWSGGR